MDSDMPARSTPGHMSQHLRASGQSLERWQGAHCMAHVDSKVFKLTEPSGAKSTWTPELGCSSLRKRQLFKIGTASNSEIKELQTDTYK